MQRLCGDQFTRVQGVYTLLGTDESDSLYRGSHLVARESGHRRDAVAVRTQGETCGHRWDLVLQRHKGQTLVRVDVLEAISPDESGYVQGIAVDGSGNVFFAADGVVSRINAQDSSITALNSNFGAIASLALDGGGNIFVADLANQSVYKKPRWPDSASLRKSSILATSKRTGRV